MLRFIHFLFGYVVFKATGHSPERFINLISYKGIKLWDIKKIGDSLYASILPCDYKLLRPLAFKTKLKIKIQKKIGLPFFMQKYKKRIGLIAGPIIFILMIYILSLYVWVVRVEGNSLLTSEEITQTISELGIKPGSFKNGLDLFKIQNETMQRFDKISWMSINIEGSVATISINESLKPPDIVPINKPCNIKASRDAQIIRIEVYKGTAQIKNGDAVLSGQTLVNGIIEDGLGGSIVTHAQARAIASTKYEFNESFALDQTISIPTGKKIKNKKINFFGFDIPLSLPHKYDAEYDIIYNNKNLSFFSVQLPICIKKKEFIELKQESQHFTEQQAKLETDNRLLEKEQTELKNCKIIKCDKTTNVINGVYCVNAVYKCEENIAIEEEIDVS